MNTELKKEIEKTKRKAKQAYKKFNISKKRKKVSKKITKKVTKKKNPIIYESYGEELIDNTLKLLGIKYFREKEIEGMNSKKGYPLRFDFFISSLNLAIEYDGEQHFNPNMHNSRKDFLYYVSCDRRKNIFCKKNNIRLIRLNKKHINDIENIITQQIKYYKD